MNHRIFERKWRPSGHVFLSVAKPSCLLYRPQFLLRSAKTWQFVVCAFVPKGSTEEERRDNSTTAHESCVVLGSLLTVDALTERSSLSCLSLPRPCAQPRRERRYTGKRVFFSRTCGASCRPCLCFSSTTHSGLPIMQSAPTPMCQLNLDFIVGGQCFLLAILAAWGEKLGLKGKGTRAQARFFFFQPDISHFNSWSQLQAQGFNLDRGRASEHILVLNL